VPDKRTFTVYGSEVLQFKEKTNIFLKLEMEFFDDQQECQGKTKT
jgi:hypothetical protein